MNDMNDKQIDELFDKVSESAYPVNIQGDADDGGIFRISTPGLSKREWFAGMAMQGLLSGLGNKRVSHYMAEEITDEAVMMADKLIKQLKEQKYDRD